MTVQRSAAGLWLLVLAIGLTACRSGSSDPDPAGVYGAKIYEFEGDPADLFEEWQAAGLNTVFAGEELHADAGFRMAAREQGIRTFVILPVFYDPVALDADSSLAAIDADGNPAVDDWVRFVCPSRQAYRAQKVEIIRQVVREQDPDGISIDFIRHFVFWETVFPDTPADSLPATCFDDHCLARFQRDLNIALPDTVTEPCQAASWILANRKEEWTNWKCRLITSMVEDIAAAARAEKPDILINLHIVPWRSGDYDGAIRWVAGQDIGELSGLADYVSPMTYHHMVKRPPEWVGEVVSSMAAESQTPVLPSIQVGKAYLTEGLTVDAFRDALESALAPPSAGVVFWSWDRLAASPEKMEVAGLLLSDGDR